MILFDSLSSLFIIIFTLCILVVYIPSVAIFILGTNIALLSGVRGKGALSTGPLKKTV